jgi:hypothetical protein
MMERTVREDWDNGNKTSFTNIIIILILVKSSDLAITILFLL